MRASFDVGGAQARVGADGRRLERRQAAGDLLLRGQRGRRAAVTEHKSMVAAYSARAKARPTVSTPLTWDELEAARSPSDLVFELEDVLARVETHGDRFAGRMAGILPGGCSLTCRRCSCRAPVSARAMVGARKGALEAMVTAATAAGRRRRKRRSGRRWWKESFVMPQPSPRRVGASCEHPGSCLKRDRPSLDSARRSGRSRRSGLPPPGGSWRGHPRNRRWVLHVVSCDGTRDSPHGAVHE